MKKYIELLRPKHYIKNLLIFVSVVFDRNLFNFAILGRTMAGFIAFSFLASTIYIVNDIRDVEADRLHEVKRNRPIASGAVRISAAYVLIVLLVGSIIGISLIWNFNAESIMIMTIYFFVNFGYSFGLKNIPFLDITLLVSGFFLRVLFGAVLVESTVSIWVQLTVITLSFYLALGKRRNELRKVGTSRTRKVLEYYSNEFLDKFMYLCLTLAIAFYALWSADAEIIIKYGTDKLVWTVPLVIILLMKYSADVESNSYGDPVDVILHDKSLITLGIGYVIILLFLIYKPMII